MQKRVDGNPGRPAARRLSPLATVIGICALKMMSCFPAGAQERTEYPVNNTHIVYHDVHTDPQGAILAWFSDKPSVAYDHNLRQIWDFWRQMRTCGDGIGTKTWR